MAADLDADPRVVADAYRVLAADGLVELRPRAGVFVGQGTAAPGVAEAPSAVWLADVVAEGVRRGVAAPALAGALEQATRSRQLQVAVVAGTVDQAVGIARELRDDFGMDATPTSPTSSTRTRRAPWPAPTCWWAPSSRPSACSGSANGSTCACWSSTCAPTC
jgi:hypothetical protein